MAWIELHTGSGASDDELRAFCCEKMAEFKVPLSIRCVEQIPITVARKQQKLKMQEIAAQFAGGARRQAVLT